MASHDDDDDKLDRDDDETPTEDLTDEDRALLGASANGDDEEEEGDGTSTPTSSGSGQPPQNVLVTKDGLKKLQDELVMLESTRRREVAGRLKEAISYGDLSENSEYEDAKNEQAFVEGRIAELRAMIKNAQVIAESAAGNKSKVVKIGSTVKIQNLTDKDDVETYTIVGSTEADPMNAKISNESPIGAAIIDREEGEEVMVKAPAGAFKYKIVKVS